MVLPAAKATCLQGHPCITSGSGKPASQRGRVEPPWCSSPGPALWTERGPVRQREPAYGGYTTWTPHTCPRESCDLAGPSLHRSSPRAGDCPSRPSVVLTKQLCLGHPWSSESMSRAGRASSLKDRDSTLSAVWTYGLGQDLATLLP